MGDLPDGWHICDCSPDCGAWEPDDTESKPTANNQHTNA